MWVAISKLTPDGSRRVVAIGFEGAVVEVPDEAEAWVAGMGEALIVRDPD